SPASFAEPASKGVDASGWQEARLVGCTGCPMQCISFAPLAAAPGLGQLAGVGVEVHASINIHAPAAHGTILRSMGVCTPNVRGGRRRTRRARESAAPAL